MWGGIKAVIGVPYGHFKCDECNIKTEVTSFLFSLDKVEDGKGKRMV